MDLHSRLEQLNRATFEAEKTGDQETLKMVLDGTSFKLVRSNGQVRDKDTMREDVGGGDGNNRDIVDGSLEINIYGEEGNERFGVVTCIIRMERKGGEQGIGNFFRNIKVFVGGEHPDDWRCVAWQVVRV
jgi:Domain of unknown function (DUF4440)